MRRTTLFVCFPLLLGVSLVHAAVAGAQDVERLKSGIVKITATEGNKKKVGTGFIVKLDSEVVYIVTAAHVVSGDPHPRVQFFSRQDVLVQAQVKHAEGGDEETGMALLAVRGNESIPIGLAALPLAITIRVSGGEDIMVIGHPVGAGDWAIIKGSIASRDGRYLKVDANIDEGNSGGPIIHSGQVVGLIGGAQRYGKGVTIGTVREYLEGHGIFVQEGTDKDVLNATEMPRGILASQCSAKPITPLRRKPEVFVSKWMTAIERMKTERNIYDLQNLFEIWGRIPVGLTGAQLVAEARYTVDCLAESGHVETGVSTKPGQYWGVQFDIFQ